MYLEQAQRHTRILLTGLRNFRSNKRNLELLLSGFARLHRHIPSDVLTVCTQFCYAVNSFDHGDRFDSADSADCFAYSAHDSIVSCCDERTQKVFGRLRFTRQMVRKVWTINIVDCAADGAAVSLGLEAPMKLDSMNAAIDVDAKRHDTLRVLCVLEEGDDDTSSTIALSVAINDSWNGSAAARLDIREHESYRLFVRVPPHTKLELLD